MSLVTKKHTTLVEKWQLLCKLRLYVSASLHVKESVPHFTFFMHKISCMLLIKEVEATVTGQVHHPLGCARLYRSAYTVASGRRRTK